jgi:hypothetical protein
VKKLSRLDVITVALFLAALTAILGFAIAAGEWQDYWVQFVVGNVLPPSLWTLLGITVAYVRMHRHVTAQHEATTAHVEGILSDHLEATASMVSRHVTALQARIEEQHLAVVKHLGKQSAHLVRQDNAMRDMGGKPKERT